ncbi:MAG: restriction endonuclease subunit S, partial [Limnoraphis robusta]
ATTGKSFLLNEIPENSIFASYLIRLEASDIYVPEYLANFLQSPYYWKQITTVSKGTAQPGANASILSKLNVPLPPLNEQKRIVAKIEALQERSQRVKAELVAIRPLLDKFRQSVLAAAFRGDLTKDWREKNPDIEPASVLLEESLSSQFENLPATWYMTTVGSVVKTLKYGTSKKCDYDIDGIPVLRIPNIVDGFIDNSDLKYTELTDQELEKISLIPGDILMIRSNGSVSLVGRTALVTDAEKNFAYAGYLIRIRPDHKRVFSPYLNLWFSSYEIRCQIEIPLRSTSGVNNINSNEVKQLTIPIASLEEQKEIVNRIDKLFKIADNIEHLYQQTETDLETLNQSILAQAFRGELVPQNPNDEPASVLLERIRKERETHSKPAKQTRKKSPKTDNNNSTQLTLEGIE